MAQESSPEQRLAGVRALVTAGPMRAYLDAVRFISNVSTGRLGAEIARECLARGASVTFAHGPGSRLPSPPEGTGDRLTLVEIDTLTNLMETLREELRGGKSQVCFHAMAVLDYIPDQKMPGKLSSDAETRTIMLHRSPKVIEQIKKIAPTVLLVGFKLEVGLSDEELEEAGQGLMSRTGAEIVVANDLERIQGGHHPARICYRRGDGIGVRSVDGKREIASALCDLVEDRIRTMKAAG
jgi:phosphopantothenoylcysteine synthetase/decarboxylase